MTELTTSQLIKIILGIFVVVAVVIGVFLFFKGNVIDFFKNLPGTEEPSGGAGASKEIGEEVEGETLEIPGEEGEEETDLSCEESDCTSTLPEELSCRLGNVFGYLHKCSRGECIRTRVKKKIYDCEFGCTDGECDACLPTGTIIGKNVLVIGTPSGSCCDEAYCAERGFLGMCKEYKCG